MEDLSNEHVEVRVDQALQALIVKFLGFVPLEDFKEILDYEYRLIQHYRLTKALIDLRSMTFYDKGAPEYVKDNWFPRVVALGLASVAFVQPQAVIGKMAMKRAHEEKESAIAMAHFGDLDEAITWLKSQGG